MLRRLHIAGALLSGVLCFLICLIWADSYRRIHDIPLRGGYEDWRLIASRGKVGFDDEPKIAKRHNAWKEERDKAFNDYLKAMRDTTDGSSDARRAAFKAIEAKEPGRDPTVTRT